MCNVSRQISSNTAAPSGKWRRKNRIQWNNAE